MLGPWALNSVDRCPPNRGTEERLGDPLIHLWTPMPSPLPRTDRWTNLWGLGWGGWGRARSACLPSGPSVHPSASHPSICPPTNRPSPHPPSQREGEDMAVSPKDRRGPPPPAPHQLTWTEGAANSPPPNHTEAWTHQALSPSPGPEPDVDAQIHTLGDTQPADHTHTHTI